jgi:benzoylformate decarboxylase
VYEPFLAGRLDGLAGEYPVWVNQPIRAQDLPGAIARACHEARTHRGPALVVVPMNDWLAPAEDPEELAAPERIVHASAADAGAIAELAALVAAARSPALVVGAGADSPAAWAALVALAERLVCPVWQEAFGGRAGFPQDHPLFAGFLPAGRASLRETLAGYDVVVAVGAPVFRQYTYEPGPLVVEGTRVAVVTDFPDEAHRSPAELAVLAAPAAVCAALLDRVPARDAPVPKSFQRPPVPAPPASGEPLVASHVLQALADRLPPSAIVLEEAPSAGPELQARIPARRPLGFLRAAMGGLGFVLPAAIGLRMGAPDRPVVAILGDGSSLYGIQGLWSAVRYEVGPLFVVLANGGYRIMDSLAALHGGAAPWPSFEGIDIAGLARAFGCAAERIDTYDDLVRRLDAIVPGLADRQEPLLLEVVVAPHREA